jgi:Holliday junction resolvasome RuvABC endonuclease subunit
MINAKDVRHNRVLGIAPFTRGFGYALLEGEGELGDFGLAFVKGEKNSGCLKRMEEMIGIFTPQVIAIDNAKALGTRRSKRVQELFQDIAALSVKHKIKLRQIAKVQVNQAILGRKEGTKYEIARRLADWFPEDLAQLLPRKRKPWDCENPRMYLFDAVGIAFITMKSLREK